MKKYFYFSERYKEIISEYDFIPIFSFKDKRAITNVILEFDAPMVYQPNRYDSLIQETTALFETISIFGTHRNWGLDYVHYDEEMLCKRDEHELFDIIEIQYELLSSESAEYQSKVNEVFDDIDCPFRLLNGKIIKIDAKQFEQDLKKKTLDILEKLRCDEPKYQAAYEEFIKAIEQFNRGDYKDAILQAEYSFESMMKIMLNNPDLTTAAANALIEKITESDYFSNIPEEAIGIMKDKVLLSLPTIRNKCGSGHGQGAKPHAIPKSVANLAINLAATLNTFLIELKNEKMFEQSTLKDLPPYEDLPF